MCDIHSCILQADVLSTQSFEQLTGLVTWFTDSVSVYYIFSLRFHCLVLYVHACCIIVTCLGEPGEIESYLDD